MLDKARLLVIFNIHVCAHTHKQTSAHTDSALLKVDKLVIRSTLISQCSTLPEQHLLESHYKHISFLSVCLFLSFTLLLSISSWMLNLKCKKLTYLHVYQLDEYAHNQQ